MAAQLPRRAKRFCREKEEQSKQTELLPSLLAISLQSIVIDPIYIKTQSPSNALCATGLCLQPCMRDSASSAATGPVRTHTHTPQKTGRVGTLVYIYI